MAWQWHPARWWLGAILVGSGAVSGMGCTDLNPAFGRGGGPPATGTSGEDEGSSSASEASSTSPTDGADVSGGTGTCDEPVAGMEVTVVPVGGWPNGVCTPLVGSGLLEVTTTGYALHRQGCTVGLDPLELSFLPKGPAGSVGTNYCVDYDITFRDGCGLDRAIIRAAGMDALIYVAGTSPSSPVEDAFTLTEIPLTGGCGCDVAACCPDSLPPGPYALGIMVDGHAEEVPQGNKTPLTTNAGNYDFEVLQSRVLQECSDPMQFDWYYRRALVP